MASSSRRAQRATPPPSPAHNTDYPRQILVPGHTCVGCIVWLPPFDPFYDVVYCSKKSCSREKLDEGGYDHPVVILKIRQRDNSKVVGDLICTVALMSTFSNTTLQRYNKRKARDARFRESIPVQMSSPSDMQSNSAFIPEPEYLHLERRGMKKQGYVRYDHTFDVSVAQLRTYGYRKGCVYHFRLAEESYKVLMERLGMSVEVFEDTDLLFETAERRLAALVATNSSARTQEQQRPALVPASPGVPTNERFPLLPSSSPYRLSSSQVREPSYYSAAVRAAEVSTRIVPPPYRPHQQWPSAAHTSPRAPTNERQHLIPAQHTLASSYVREPSYPSYYGATVRAAEVSTRVVAPPYRQQRLPVYVDRYPPRVPEPSEGCETDWGIFFLSVALLTAGGFFVKWCFS